MSTEPEREEQATVGGADRSGDCTRGADSEEASPQ